MAFDIYQFHAADRKGNVVPGATVEVRVQSTGNLATIYSDATGTAKSNPFIADGDGYAFFHAANGQYKVTVRGGGAYRVFNYVRIGDENSGGGGGSGETVYRPEDYGAVGDGTTDDSAALAAMIAAVNTAGGNAHIRITKKHLVTGASNLTQIPALTVSDVTMECGGGGKIIASGSQSMYPILNVGPALAVPTTDPRPLAANAARHATSLVWTNATSLLVGDIVRIEYTSALTTVPQAFAFRIISKTSNTTVISHPLPWALTTATSLTVTRCTPIERVTIRDLKVTTSSFTGGALSPYQLRGAYDCRIEGTRSSNMKSGSGILSGVVNCQVYDDHGYQNGSVTSQQAFAPYAATGCIFDNIKVTDGSYFGVVFSYCHHISVTNVDINRLGGSAQFVRGFETWDVSRSNFANIRIDQVYGAGVFLENQTRDCNFTNLNVSVLKPTTATAQGISTNGTANTDNLWTNCYCRGTELLVDASAVANTGGYDINVSAGAVPGGADTDNIFINCSFDTESVQSDSQIIYHEAGETRAKRKLRAPLFGAGEAGSVSAPVFTKYDDLNTGMYFPAADRIGFAVGGELAAFASIHATTTDPQWTIGNSSVVGFGSLGIYNSHAYEAISIDSPTRTSGTPNNDANGYMRFADRGNGSTFAFGAYNITHADGDKRVVFESANSYDFVFQYAGAHFLRVKSTGSVIINQQALATNATDGFLYIPTCSGTPTGVPTAFTGRIPMIYDTANNQFWFYNSGWKQPKTPSAAAIVTWQ